MISGLCLPIECTPETLETFSTAATAKINSLIIKLQENRHLLPIKDDSGLLRNFTRMQLQIEPSHYMTEEWYSDVRVGYIISLIFCAFVFLFFCIIPNVYVVFRHYSKETVDPAPKLDWQF